MGDCINMGSKEEGRIRGEATIRLAIPTRGRRGMNDAISKVFARSRFFTFIEIVDGDILSIDVEENMVFNLEQGTGPLVVRMLKEKGVDLVAASEYGLGIKTLLDLSGIRRFKVVKGSKVKDVVSEAKKRSNLTTPQDASQLEIKV